jgi:hypothetical protein
MNDEYQVRFEKPLIDFYKNIRKNIDMEKIYKDLKVYTDKDKWAEKVYVYPLVKYKIYNNKVYVEKKIRKKYNDKNDERFEQNLRLIEKTIEYCKKNNLQVPNTTLYIFISDRVPWYGKNTMEFDNLPIYVNSKPKNFNLPIFPDTSFECLSLETKYGEKCYDWDEIKKKMIEYNKKVKNKENKIFFKGTRTTVFNHKLRENLEIYAKNRKNYIIQLDAWNKYIPIYKFADYNFLLNLPGRYPWSNRFKYLFLTRSLVINISVITINFGKYFTVDMDWETLIDYVIDGKDYINIILKFYQYNGDDNDIKKETKRLNENEFNKVVNKLNKIYETFETNKDKYDKIINNGYENVKQLTNERIYSYIYRAIIENSKIIKE